MKCYVSGVHSGPNPSPGLGTARSLRLGYPGVTIVAVDYSVRSSGLHHEVFDEVWLQPSWDHIDLALYEQQIQRVGEAGNLWFSGLDLETLWLAESLPGK